MTLKRIRGGRQFSHFAPNERGGIAVEFALGAPILVLLLMGGIDFGLALNRSSALEAAARAGAQYAMRFPSDTTGISDVVKKSVTFDPSTLTVTSQSHCECPNGGNANSCAKSECGGQTPYTYVTVKVSMPYSSPLPTSMIIGDLNLTGSAVFRAN